MNKKVDSQDKLIKHKNNINDDKTNEEEDDAKLDEDLFYLQRQINVMIDDRKKIQKETQILNQRVVLLNKQMNDLDMKYNNAIIAFEKRLEINKQIREGEKVKLDIKYKQHKEIEEKRMKILNEKDNKTKQRPLTSSSKNH